VGSPLCSARSGHISPPRLRLRHPRARRAHGAYLAGGGGAPLVGLRDRRGGGFKRVNTRQTGRPCATTSISTSIRAWSSARRLSGIERRAIQAHIPLLPSCGLGFDEPVSACSCRRSRGDHSSKGLRNGMFITEIPSGSGRDLGIAVDAICRRTSGRPSPPWHSPAAARPRKSKQGCHTSREELHVSIEKLGQAGRSSSARDSRPRPENRAEDDR